jgi:hypothetical protein
MKSSRNPKILNYVIRNVLDPIFHLLDKLLVREQEANQYIEEVTSIENTQNEKVNSDVEAYGETEYLLEKTIKTDKDLISDMIHRHLLNPNIGYGEGEVGEIPHEETLFITDKLISDIGYGFVKNGVSVLLAGITNRGIALGPDTNIEGEFTFLNPNEEAKFPSFTVNNILKLSTYFTFIATNAGLVEYDITTGNYLVKTTSHGLNTNMIKRIIPLKSHNALKANGYLAGTNKGVSFSPSGDRWLNVDKTFKQIITCFHTSQKLEEVYTSVFIGTTKGLYFFDANNYITQENGEVVLLEGVMRILPSNYINAVAYNSLTDTLYVATDNGITIVDDIMSYIEQGRITEIPHSYRVLNSNHGLSSTLCFDIALMPNQKIIIATANGITLTNDFITFSYITKRVTESSSGLKSYMCNKIIRKSAVSITVLHPIGLTEGIVL